MCLKKYKDNYNGNLNTQKLYFVYLPLNKFLIIRGKNSFHNYIVLEFYLDIISLDSNIFCLLTRKCLKGDV